MIARLKRVNGGRARVWWVHHHRDAIRAMQLTAIVGLFLFASTMDYQDQLDAERAARAQIAEDLRQEKVSRQFPRTTFVIEARTPAEAYAKLSEITGDLETQRYLTRYGMKPQ